MKNLYLLIVLSICTQAVNSQCQYQWEWALDNDGTYAYKAEGVDLIADSLGNIYVLGSYSNPTFTVGGLSINLPAGKFGNIFYAKFDKYGNIIWLKRFNSTIHVGFPKEICFDKNMDIYIAGGYSFGTVSEGFVRKIDQDGNTLWTNIYSNLYVESIAFDDDNSMYIAGPYWGNVNFGAHSLTHPGSMSYAFFVKFDSLGVSQWATKFEHDGNKNIELSDMVVSSDKCIYFCGFTLSTTITTGSFVLNMSNRSYYGKLDALGNLDWMYNTEANEQTGECVVSDTCFYLKTKDHKLRKYDLDGNQKWALIKYTNGHMQLDNNGYLYMSGSGSWDTTYIKIDLKTGTTVDGDVSTGNHITNGICLNPLTNNIYVTGYFFENLQFGSQSLTLTNDNDFFLAKSSINGIDITNSQQIIEPGIVERGYELNIENEIICLGDDAGASTLKYYLSIDSIYDLGDTYLGSTPVNAILQEEIDTAYKTIIVPVGTSIGDWYIVSILDANNVLSECNETNNNAFTRIYVRGPWPDHTILQASVTPTIIDDGGTIDIYCEAHNIGTKDTFGLVHYYLSSDTLYDAGDIYLDQDSIGNIIAGDSAIFSNTLTIPVATTHQNWYILFFADPVDSLIEINETNNLQYIQISVETLYADLIVNNPVSNNSTIPRGTDLGVSCDVINQGTKDCGVNTLKYYLSADQSYDGSDVELDTYTVGGLTRDGGLETVNDMVTIPIGTTTGAWYLLFYSDAVDLVEESNDLNNINYLAINIIDPVSILEIGNDTVICDGANMVLDAGSGYDSYLWSEGSTSQTITVSSDDTYVVTVTTSGYEQKDTIIISPQTNFVDLGTDLQICAGESHTFDAGAFSNYIWSDNTTLQTIDVNTTGDYSVTVTDNYSCQSIDTVNITVNLLPAISFTGNTVICEGDTTDISASGGSTYLWNTTETTPTITVNPLISTTYYITATSSEGCDATDNVSVTVNPLPTVSFSAAFNDVCEDAGNVVLTEGTPTGGTYTGTGVATNLFNTSIAGVGTHSITYTYSDGTCDNSIYQDITVISLPNAGSNSDTVLCSNGSTVDMLTLLEGNPDAGGIWIDSTGATINNLFDPTIQNSGTYNYIVPGLGICEDDTVELNINILSEPTITITGNSTFCIGEGTYLTSDLNNYNQWYMDGSPITSADDVTYYPTVSGNYTVENTMCNLSSGIESIVVNIPTIPLINVNGATEFCDGGSVILASDQATGNLWSNGETTQVVVADTSGDYFITYIDLNGCTGYSDTVQVIAHSLPPVPTITQLGNVLTSSSGTGNQWYVDGNPLIGETGQFYTPIVSGVYHVQVTNAFGCTSISDTLMVIINNLVENTSLTEIKFFPNPVSDVINIKVKNTKDEAHYIQIIDILGKEIYSAPINSETMQLDMSNYKKGIYYVKIYGSELIKVEEIVKQ